MGVSSRMRASLTSSTARTAAATSALPSGYCGRMRKMVTRTPSSLHEFADVAKRRLAERAVLVEVAVPRARRAERVELGARARRVHPAAAHEQLQETRL
ncbi:hypothetical protein MSG28_005801 [Choristoneura fumiferana]|uniref:Uncharacterized protein n=1 Tax=Choristoneura fumiferana TaxID=7141 RepID=A0ACC0L148_CHOFU|nr:hypothetical protein MSG28_005801 [Choristoneura fumiferana]